MRVLFVSDGYFPRINGVSTSIRTFRTDLAACGVETTLIAPRYGDGAPEDRGIVRVPGMPIPGDPEDRCMRWRALVAATDAFDPGTVDLVHVHTPFLAHYAGVRLARRLGVPCIGTYHTFFEDYLHHYLPLLPWRAGATLARLLTRAQCRDLHTLIAPSEPMRARLLEYGVAAPIEVLPTGLPADRFRPGNGSRFRRFAGLPPERPLLVYVGRVAHEKNIEFLLRMYVEARRAVPEAMFVIAGEGPAREALRQRVARLALERDVRFVGNLDRDGALLDCYAAADAFVFASRTETQGLVLLEALAQGAPVVSTAVLGTRSILRPGCGALIVEESVEPFAREVVRVLTDAGLRATLADEGRRYARSWSSRAAAGRLADLYRRVHAAFQLLTLERA